MSTFSFACFAAVSSVFFFLAKLRVLSYTAPTGFAGVFQMALPVYGLTNACLFSLN